jgi:anti-sigma regulatory factor (Ser/Thr protein kinase)
VSPAIDDQPVTLVRQGFVLRHVHRLRRLVAWAAQRVGLDHERGQHLALAVTEAASNAVKHGGGHGLLELIRDDNRALIAEISDDGPGMATKRPGQLPPAEQTDGRGLFLVEHLCDRVQYRTDRSGTTVHLEMDI